MSTQAVPSIERPRTSSGGLPPHLNPLVGREKEMALLRYALVNDGFRLLTLAGPPGVGKTRLALEAAETARAEFPGGAWFVDLARIDDPASVPPAMLEALTIKGDTGLTPLARIHEHVRDRELLAAHGVVSLCLVMR